MNDHRIKLRLVLEHVAKAASLTQPYEADPWEEAHSEAIIQDAKPPVPIRAVRPYLKPSLDRGGGWEGSSSSVSLAP